MKISLVASDRLPGLFPTHLHSEVFWECLGRAVATFGFLEETLTKAFFAFTATRKYDQSEIEEAYENWLPKLQKVLSDPLGALIASYDTAVKNSSSSTIESLNKLVADLRAVSELRNVLCHGSWRAPDSNGKSVPFFIDKKQRKFEIGVDIAFLKQTQTHVMQLACAIINTVTQTGYQFPGSTGPGEKIW